MTDEDRPPTRADIVRLESRVELSHVELRGLMNELKLRLEADRRDSSKEIEYLRNSEAAAHEALRDRTDRNATAIDLQDRRITQMETNENSYRDRHAQQHVDEHTAAEAKGRWRVSQVWLPAVSIAVAIGAVMVAVFK